MEEAGASPQGGAARDLLRDGAGAPKPQALREIEADGAPRVSTGVPELDRVLGGGLVPGSVTLLAGEPGIGKSTLALQLAAGAETQRPILYVTGEESGEQVRLRADRLPRFPAELMVLAETRVEALVTPWRDVEPAVVLVDSIQTLHTDRVESAPGSVAQVRESADLLAAIAKARGAALVLVGHVSTSFASARSKGS